MKHRAKMAEESAQLWAMAAGAFIATVGTTPAFGQVAATTTVAPPASASASADEAGATPIATAENNPAEIVVTARKREETAMRAPVELQVFTAKQIETLRIVNVSALASVTPGLQVSEGFGAVGAVSFLRGIGNGSSPVFIDQSVQLNIDGASLNQGTYFRSGTFDLGQIEVLKGPQALFFGKSTSAGIIAIHTADPTPQWETRLTSGYELRADEGRVESVVSGPLTDTLGLRLAGFYDSMKGFFKIPNPADPRRRGPDETGYGGRATLKYDNHDNLTLRAKFTQVHDDSDFWSSDRAQRGCTLATAQKPTFPYDDCRLDAYNGGGPLGLPYVPGDYSIGSPAFATGAPSPLFRNGIPYNFTDTSNGVVDASYKLGHGLTLTSVSTYSRVSYGESGATGLTTPGDIFALAMRFSQRDLSQELRLASSFTGSWINFMVGGYYSDTRANYHQIFDLPSATFNTDEQIGYGGHSGSFFGQILLTPTSKLELSIGARQTYDTKFFDRLDTFANTIPLYQSYGLAIPNDQTSLVPRDLRYVTGKQATPEVTLTYRPTADLTWFASYKRGYKGPGFNVNAVADSFIPTPSSPTYQLNPFDGEKVRGVEGGVKAQLLDRRLAVTLTGYRYLYLGQQVSFVDSRTNVANITNGDNLRIYGVDGSFDLRVPGVDGLSLNGLFEYNRAQYTWFPAASCYGGQDIAHGCSTDSSFLPGARFQSLTGQTPYRAPRWTGQWGGEYRRPIAGGYDATFSTNFNYSSSYYTAPEKNPSSLQKSYVTIDASLRFGRPGGFWELAIIGRNLTDQYIAVDGVDDGEVTPHVASDTQLFIQRPRQILLQLTIRPNLL